PTPLPISKPAPNSRLQVPPAFIITAGLREIPNSRQASDIASPSNRRDTNRKRFPNTSSMAWTPPTRCVWQEVLPMCPVQSFTYALERLQERKIEYFLVL